MNEDRILTLAENLEQADPDNFRMAQWLRVEDYNIVQCDHPDDHLQHIHDWITPTLQTHPASALIRAVQDCGTTACVAGWTVILFGTPEDLRDYGNQVSHYAAVLLDIGLTESRQLFLPNIRDVSYDDITAADAADTLRRFAHTGIVDWETAIH